MGAGLEGGASDFLRWKEGGRSIFKAQWRGGKGILMLEKIIPEHDFSSSIAWSLNINIVKVKINAY